MTILAEHRHSVTDYRRRSVVSPTNQHAKSKEKTHGMTTRAISGRNSIHSVFWRLGRNTGVIR